MTYNFKCGEAIGWSRWLNLETFQENRMMKGENAVMVHATLKFAPMWPIISTSTLDVVHCALRGEEPANVRYIVYERRSRSGKLSNPRPLFTTRKALAQLCRNGNLDDINDVGLPPCIASVVLGDMELPRPHAFTSYRDDDSDFEFDPHGDESVDHEMHEIEDENSSMQTDDTAVEVKSEPRNLNAWLADLPKCSGKTVVLLGAAARTWESVLYWLYTGVIAFAPLSSAGKQKRDEFIQEYLTANPGRPIPTSCKSIYRLADDLNLGSLKRRALQHLESQLTAETNLHELFSDFTSKREDVKRIELLEVIKHWDKLKSSTALKEKLVEITSGKLPHAAGVLADLLMRTSLNDDDHPEKS
ncbi:hypothetical protein EW026_g519 [Hermanssonia centrifuga]|uniref:Uncharacterized protein n=1 Tax=Hermanssonia centrifuga TaxID=98765 RepID=A0A4V3XBJ7_9APHY|nr:hypothetical protein EW026_g519 [Hermanssonia centrifuga]